MHTAISGCRAMCQKDGREVAPIERERRKKEVAYERQKKKRRRKG